MLCSERASALEERLDFASFAPGLIEGVGTLKEGENLISISS
jgi:hypothetical protein